jgi:hypothetical protein
MGSDHKAKSADDRLVIPSSVPPPKTRELALATVQTRSCLCVRTFAGRTGQPASKSFTAPATGTSQPNECAGTMLS